MYTVLLPPGATKMQLTNIYINLNNNTGKVGINVTLRALA